MTVRPSGREVWSYGPGVTLTLRDDRVIGKARAAPRAAARCGGYDQPEANLTLADARRFHRFDLFSAGRRVVHLPLTAVLCTMQPTADKPVITRPPESYGLMPSWTFIYGTCTASGNEGGCAPPVDIQNDGSCWNNLGLFAKRDRPRLHRLRGTPFASNESADGSQITLYSRWTTITIDARDARNAMRVVQALRGVNASFPVRSQLPPPSQHTLDGKTKCNPR